MKELQQIQFEVDVMLVRLYDEKPQVPSVPWKFTIQNLDWYWPIRWWLCPLDDARNVWLVKRVSPDNPYALERLDYIGVEIGGNLVYVEPEWNNEVIQIWNKESVLSLFKDVRDRRLSGVAVEENWTQEEKEKAEKWHKLVWVIRMLLKDEDVLESGERAFRAYIERYYQKWLKEFGDLFEKLATLKPQERKGLLEDLKVNLEKEGFEEGYDMYVYYP